MSQMKDNLLVAVKERFTAIATSPGQEKKFPTGPVSAKKLGYDPQEIDALPPQVTESFCGVGSPRGLGELRALRPGGRLQMADIILYDDVTSNEVARLGEWSD
jgi:hypothetical protein